MATLLPILTLSPVIAFHNCVFMHILIYEPQHSGHRYTTVRVLIDALNKLDQEHQCIESITVSLSDDGIRSEEFKQQLSPVENLFSIAVVPAINSSMHPLQVGWRGAQSLKSLLQSGSFDHIYVPYADALLQVLTLFKFSPLSRWWPTADKVVIEALTMNSAFAYSYGRANLGWFGRINRRLLALFALRHSGCDRVHLNDPLGISWLVQNKPDLLDQVKLLPDPISVTKTYDRQVAREKLGLDSGGRVICCAGVINTRKGADTLVEAFDLAQLRPGDRLLLAGKLSDEIAEMVQQRANPAIVVFDRYITEDELSLALCAADLIAAPYRQFIGSASIVIRAAQCSRMVLTNNTGWPEYIVNRFQLGLTTAIDNPQQFAEVLAKALDQSESFAPGCSSMQFVDFNKISNIHAHWTSLLRQRLEFEPDPSEIPWDI